MRLAGLAAGRGRWRRPVPSGFGAGFCPGSLKGQSRSSGVHRPMFTPPRVSLAQVRRASKRRPRSRELSAGCRASARPEAAKVGSRRGRTGRAPVCNPVCNRSGHAGAQRGMTWHDLNAREPSQAPTCGRPGRDLARPGTTWRITPDRLRVLQGPPTRPYGPLAASSRSASRRSMKSSSGRAERRCRSRCGKAISTSCWRNSLSIRVCTSSSRSACWS